MDDPTVEMSVRGVVLEGKTLGLITVPVEASHDVVMVAVLEALPALRGLHLHADIRHAVVRLERTPAPERAAGPLAGEDPTAAPVTGPAVTRPRLDELDDRVVAEPSPIDSAFPYPPRDYSADWRPWPSADGYWWASARIDGVWARPVVVAMHRGLVMGLGHAEGLRREGTPPGTPTRYRWAGLFEPDPPSVGEMHPIDAEFSGGAR